MMLGLLSQLFSRFCARRSRKDEVVCLPGAPVSFAAAVSASGKEDGNQEADRWKQRLVEGGYFEVMEGRLEHRSKGYFAAKDLKEGEALLFEISYCSSPVGVSACEDLAAICRQKEDSSFFKHSFLSLEKGRFTDESGSKGRQLEAILATNARECSRQPGYVALFVAISHFRHSCCPNAFVDSCESQAVVRALQDIKEGQEILVSYVPVSLNLEARRRWLGKGFECKCQRCEKEDLEDPQFSVPCKCSKGKFSAAAGSPEIQVCEKCKAKFQLSEALQHLSECEAANAFMRKSEALRADSYELAKALEKRLEERKSPAPSLHPQVLQVINNVANCYYYAAKMARGTKKDPKVLLEGFYKYKKKFMAGLEANHGTGTRQRDSHFFFSLHRMLEGSFPSPEERYQIQEQLSILCLLHFGQTSVPEELLASQSKR
eukprot:TRINITY_DN31980_c0_g2_i1.p1 TRINITY_DN31980_c0_g2~~TRINITY_DN31980_c0_g2_i1.p1  ORF type:complete len:432 (-),score=92.67 TRINITY_DN31980_c0_g2_i1:37-1332(-)